MKIKKFRQSSCYQKTMIGILINFVTCHQVYYNFRKSLRKFEAKYTIESQKIVIPEFLSKNFS